MFIITAKQNTFEYAKAQQIAKQFGLNLISPNRHNSESYLIVTERHVELHHPGWKQAFVLDFEAGKAKYRQSMAIVLGHPLVKAVGVKSNNRLNVLDLTAGVGDDAYLLASAGCQVSMVERHPIVAALLDDALKRLKNAQPGFPLEFIYGDALSYLQQAIATDVVTYDPMYPPRIKHAKAKKSMQVLQKLVNKDTDVEDVFNAALRVAKKRVVVKRPKSVPPLGDKAPNHSIHTEGHRFDVYVTG